MIHKFLSILCEYESYFRNKIKKIKTLFHMIHNFMNVKKHSYELIIYRIK
jgi:hypothetical protein